MKHFGEEVDIAVSRAAVTVKNKMGERLMQRVHPVRIWLVPNEAPVREGRAWDLDPSLGIYNAHMFSAP